MSSVLPTDKTLVQRGTTLHSAPADMSTVHDTDLLLINRAGVDYKCSFADWKASQASINKPRMLTPANGAGQTIGPVSDTITAINVVGGKTVLTFATGKDLALFKAGDAVEQENTALAAVSDFDLSRIDATYYSSSITKQDLRALFASGKTTETVGTLDKYSAGSVIWDAGDPRAAFVMHTSNSAGSLGGSNDLINWSFAGSIRLGASNFTGFRYYWLDSRPSLYGGITVSGATLRVPAGTVESVDATANTMTLSTSHGTWGPINAGHHVLGPVKLSTDAAVGETPTFTSSAFSATGSVTHASSDWQVTLKTDTAFASPVVQSMADATHKLSWDGGPLQANTDYIARVRHNGGSLQSPWSDAVGFKTKAAFVAVVKPGMAWRVASNTGVLTPCTAPAKFINMATGVYNGGVALGAGVDYKVYACPQAGTVFTELSSASGQEAVATAVATDSKLTGGGNYCGWLRKDGYPVWRFSGTNYQGTATASAVGTFGTYCNVMYAIGTDDKLYVAAAGDRVLNLPAVTGWAAVGAGIPIAGKRIKSCAALGGISNTQGTDALLVLYTDGTLYHHQAGGNCSLPPGFSNTSTPVQISPGVKFVEVACAGGAYTASQGVSALTDAGVVYWANIQLSITWGPYAAVGKCRSPIYGGYTGANDRFVLKDDGFIYWCNGTSTTFTKLDYTTHSAPQTGMTTLGSMPNSLGADGIGAYFVISD